MRRAFDSFHDAQGEYIPVTALRTEEFDPWLASASPATKAWLADVKFNAKTAGSMAVLPKFEGDGQGGIDRVLLSVGSGDAMSTPWSYSELPKKLPAGKSYGVSGSYDPDALALGWALGSYTFRAYKSEKPGDAGQTPPKLQISPSALVASAASATYLVRDLINYCAEDMRPEELEAATRSLGERHGATVTSIVGEDLLDQNFPMIHAVGRAATTKGAEPRLVDLRWKDDPSLPLVALVGKGVCFDTGGLDIKPAAGMRNMKKDMGGAATVLGLASMIMESDLPVRLRVLIAAVENSVGGDAFRPGDVLKSRRGLTTEVDNTDAEGRLIISDAMSYACEEKPDLLIDFATLTGAQR